MAVRAGGMTDIRIVPFRRELAPAFQRLNLAWIERLFVVEDADRKVLGDPEHAILAPGGQIFFALDGGEPIGTVAMIRVSAARYELAKMAVAPSHQQRGIGEMLGAAAIAFARDAGAETVFLQTNSRLDGAIRLYERLGFGHAVDPDPPEYARSDVYMELPIGRSGS
jgi:GNAT superfamily N-acetyltransferase